MPTTGRICFLAHQSGYLWPIARPTPSCWTQATRSVSLPLWPASRRAKVAATPQFEGQGISAWTLAASGDEMRRVIGFFFALILLSAGLATGRSWRVCALRGARRAGRADTVFGHRDSIVFAGMMRQALKDGPYAETTFDYPLSFTFQFGCSGPENRFDNGVGSVAQFA